MNNDGRQESEALISLADRLEKMLSTNPIDIEAADSLLASIKSELSIITEPSESTRQILYQIDSLNKECSQLQEQLNLTQQGSSKIQRKRRRQSRLKQEISKIEDKIARLSFQTMPKLSSSIQVTKRRISRLESELSTIKDFRHNINVAQLNWKIIPADQNLSSAVKSSYLNSIVKRGETVNIDRLYRIIETFKPIQCFIGKNEFDGYLVFLLERSSKVICDNPIVGNAVYILDGDWKNLSQQSKAELLDHHRDNVARVIHTGDWIWRIRQAIYH